MTQPQVARLELGEVNPSMETLMRVSAQLGIEFTIEAAGATAVASRLNIAGSRTQRGNQADRPLDASVHRPPPWDSFGTVGHRLQRS